jgi:hypothetical protein
VAGEKVEVFFSRQKTTKCALGGGENGKTKLRAIFTVESFPILGKIDCFFFCSLDRILQLFPVHFNDKIRSGANNILLVSYNMLGLGVVPHEIIAMIVLRSHGSSMALSSLCRNLFGLKSSKGTFYVQE